MYLRLLTESDWLRFGCTRVFIAFLISTSVIALNLARKITLVWTSELKDSKA